MISDERLREAARKVEESMLASLPDPEECKVPPPPEIGKRTRRASHPIRHRRGQCISAERGCASGVCGMGTGNI